MEQPAISDLVMEVLAELCGGFDGPKRELALSELATRTVSEQSPTDRIFMLRAIIDGEAGARNRPHPPGSARPDHLSAHEQQLLELTRSSIEHIKAVGPSADDEHTETLMFWIVNFADVVEDWDMELFVPLLVELANIMKPADFTLTVDTDVQWRRFTSLSEALAAPSVRDQVPEFWDAHLQFILDTANHENQWWSVWSMPTLLRLNSPGTNERVAELVEDLHSGRMPVELHRYFRSAVLDKDPFVSSAEE